MGESGRNTYAAPITAAEAKAICDDRGWLLCSWVTITPPLAYYAGVFGSTHATSPIGRSQPNVGFVPTEEEAIVAAVRDALGNGEQSSAGGMAQ